MWLLTGAMFLIFGSCLIPNAHALDGEVYFGYFPQSRYRANPDGTSGNARFVSGVEMGHTIAKTVRPYMFGRR